jgi:tetratricopeptide (TPR) repeat protein
LSQLFLKNFIGFETVLVKKKCLDEAGPFDEQMIGFSDHDMWLRIAGNFNIMHIDNPLVKKRQHNLQLSKNKIEHMLRDEFLIVEKAIDRYPFLEKSKQRKLASLYYAQGMALLQKGNIAEAKKELLKTIKWQPWKIKACAIYFAPTLYSLVSKRYQKFSKIHKALNWLEN